MEKKAHRGRIWKVTGNEQIVRGMCEYFTLKRAEVKKRFLRMLRGKGKKGYKVCGNRNLPSERFWSKSEVLRMWDVAPK